MNEDHEKWWISYICGDSFSVSIKKATEAAWNASRAAMKEKRFGCHAPTGKDEVRKPIWLSCLWDCACACRVSESKTDCPFWREVEG